MLPEPPSFGTLLLTDPVRDVVFSLAVAESLSCLPCGSYPCQTPVCCDSGYYTLDECGCCLTCAKAEDEVCGGPFRIAGNCAAGLRCLRQCDGSDWCNENFLFNMEGVCVNGNEAPELLRQAQAGPLAAILDDIPSETSQQPAPACSLARDTEEVVESGCPDGWVQQFGRCYKFSEEETTWKEASENCRSISKETHLVSINSKEEHEFIFKNIDEWFWTGGYYNSETQTWTWSDGTPWNYQYWFIYQPSDKGAGMCRSVKIFKTIAMTRCENRRKFICEQEATIVTSGNSGTATVVTSENSETGCPAGWKSMFDSCYQWFYTEMKTWQEAENHCQSFGGHLASIHSEEENEFISKTLLGTVWIGGRASGGETGTWTWSDGTPWDYYGPVQKAPLPTGGDCTVLYGSASGFNCEMERLYICKK